MKILLIIFLNIISCNLIAQNSDSTHVPTLVNTDSVYTSVDEEAQFPGGEKNWNKHIQKQIKRNIDELVQRNDNNGTCEIKFIVDAKGNISALRVMNMNGTILAKVATEAVKKGPNWLPAKFNGVAVKSIRTIKITFRMK